MDHFGSCICQRTRHFDNSDGLSRTRKLAVASAGRDANLLHGARKVAQRGQSCADAELQHDFGYGVRAMSAMDLVKWMQSMYKAHAKDGGDRACGWFGRAVRMEIAGDSMYSVYKCESCSEMFHT